MATSCKSPRLVPFPSRRAVTTLADMAKAQTERLGRRIRERRDELELTQKQLAALMTDSPSVDAQQISNWERGKHKPSDDNLEILAGALDTTIADLYSGPVSERKPKGETPDLMGQVNGSDADQLVLLRDEVQELSAKVDRLLTAFGLVDHAADLDALGDRVLAAFAHALEEVSGAEEAERAAG